LYAQGGKALGKSLIVLGLILAGFGFLVWVFQEILALVAAALLILAGLGLCINGVRVYWIARRAGKAVDNVDDLYRENVKIHNSDRIEG
jgi:hypothetical protein